MKFADRLQRLSVNIYLTQFDVRVLSKGICAGLIPAFGMGCFDRIDAGDLMDTLGVRECLTSLSPLLNPQSPGACILMQSRTWFHQVSGSVASGNPRLSKILLTKAKLLPGLVSMIPTLLVIWLSYVSRRTGWERQICLRRGKKSPRQRYCAW